jgi:2-oxo-3-hexenedioate decarboxylase
MNLDPQNIAMLAERVERAQLSARTLTKLTVEFPAFSMADGYAVQEVLRARSIARGNRLVGFKAGLTSKAKMKQMGVDVPSFGYLTNDMWVAESSAIAISGLIHPRVEAEVAFMTKAELSGPDCSIDEVLAATDFVLPALEVIDSRYEKFKFDLESVIADNGSAARYVAGGRPRNVCDIDLRTLGVVVEKNGEIQACAASAAVMGHPAEAVVMLVRHLHSRGEVLPAGSFVMSGGITEAIAVAAGDSVIARFQELGSLSIRFN